MSDTLYRLLPRMFTLNEDYFACEVLRIEHYTHNWVPMKEITVVSEVTNRAIKYYKVQAELYFALYTLTELAIMRLKGKTITIVERDPNYDGYPERNY